MFVVGFDINDKCRLLLVEGMMIEDDDGNWKALAEDDATNNGRTKLIQADIITFGFVLS